MDSARVGGPQADGQDLRDGALGALLGLAAGDALGASFEGRGGVAAHEVDALLSSDAALRWTDDTHMAMTLAETLVREGWHVSSEVIGDAFATAYRAQPWRGYGAGPPRVFAAAREGRSYVEAAAMLFGGSGSFGNGAAMRVAPVAIVARGETSRIVRMARTQAQVTHAHPEAVDAAVLLALVVDRALATPAGRPLDLAALDDVVRGNVAAPAIVSGWDALVTAEDDGSRLALATRLGGGIAARSSVAAAIAIAAGHADVVGAATAAILLGGDTDTVAAMAGAVVGAHRGAAAVPDALVPRLEAADRLAALAGRLVGLAHTP